MIVEGVTGAGGRLYAAVRLGAQGRGIVCHSGAVARLAPFASMSAAMAALHTLGAVQA